MLYRGSISSQVKMLFRSFLPEILLRYYGAYYQYVQDKDKMTDSALACLFRNDLLMP